MVWHGCTQYHDVKIVVNEVFVPRVEMTVVESEIAAVSGELVFVEVTERGDLRQRIHAEQMSVRCPASDADQTDFQFSVHIIPPNRIVLSTFYTKPNRFSRGLTK